MGRVGGWAASFGLVVSAVMLVSAGGRTLVSHKAAASVASPAPAVPVQPIVTASMPTKGASTGLPLPRFASLKTSPVDMRVGPGFRYPVTWVYQKRDLPVEIIREYDVWRQIKTSDGTEGWVQSLKLSGKRDFLITDAEHDLHETTEDDSPVVARVEPGVIGHITSCAVGSEWCEVSVGDVKGWLRRDEFFGVLPDEVLP